MHHAFTSLPKNLKVLGITAASSALLTLGAVTQAWAGSVTVLTAGDSSSGGTVDFSTPNINTLETAGGGVSVELASGVTATAYSPATALATGVLDDPGWISAAGFGSGGAVIVPDNPVQFVAAMSAIANSTTIEIPGQGEIALIDALETLSTVTANDANDFGINSIFVKLSAAFISGDATLIATALNDGIMQMQNAALLSLAGPELVSLVQRNPNLVPMLKVLTTLRNAVDGN